MIRAVRCTHHEELRRRLYGRRKRGGRSSRYCNRTGSQQPCDGTYHAPAEPSGWATDGCATIHHYKRWRASRGSASVSRQVFLRWCCKIGKRAARYHHDERSLRFGNDPWRGVYHHRHPDADAPTARTFQSTGVPGRLHHRPRCRRTSIRESKAGRPLR